MVSLSTVYVISIILTSLAGMGSAFVGNKVYPIKVETPTEQPDLKEKLMERLQIDDETAQDITDFIKTPVVDWKKIAPNELDFQTKYMKVYDALQRLPTNLQALYKLVDDKHSDMTGYIQNRPHTKKGDETTTAMSILSSTE